MTQPSSRPSEVDLHARGRARAIKLLHLEDLRPDGHTSFTFYDFLPGQGYEVKGAPAASEAATLADALIKADLLAVPHEDLDLFAALLLTHGSEMPPDDNLAALANASARGFAALLGNEGQRSRRMRLTRISLMLRVILDREADLSGVSAERVLPCKSPWDFLGGWAVTCDDDNLRRLRGQTIEWSQRVGLPTQLDRLGDGLWVGSHYSNGGYVVSGMQAAQPQSQEIMHRTPLVLAFDVGHERWALDFTGSLWRLEGSTVGRKLLQLPGKVHRARVVGTTLYAFDWAQADTCMRVHIDTLEADVVKTGDIIVCNDVCGHDGLLYGICKLQGRVFKMSADWTPLGTRLGAGTGEGQLLDPIMIRSEGGRLAVLNWFSAKWVELDAF